MVAVAMRLQLEMAEVTTQISPLPFHQILAIAYYVTGTNLYRLLPQSRVCQCSATGTWREPFS